MLQKFLLGIALFFSSVVMAQEPELIATEWFLEKVVVSGQENFPPVNEELPNVPLFFEDFGTGLMFVSNVCDQLSGDPVFDGNDSFQLIDLVQTLGGCIDNENLTFQLTYFQFYFANSAMSDPYFYEISDDGNGGKSMTVTNVNGDIAYYQNSVLATEDSNYIAFILFPNPTEKTFSIDTASPIDNISIYGIAGNLLFSGENPVKTVDISTLQAGIYFVEVLSGNNRSVQKLIKK